MTMINVVMRWEKEQELLIESDMSKLSDKIKMEKHEKIILAPGCNGSELLRSMAKFGANTFGYRVMSSIELSKTALIRSGINVTEDYLPGIDEAAIIDSFIREIDYFKNASFADSEQLAAAIRSMRMRIAADEANTVNEKLSQGKFREKNLAIITAYDRFMEEIRKAGMIDSISLIRKGIEEAKSFDAEFITLKEYPLTILEKALISHVSGETYEEISLTDLFHADKDGEEAVLTESYGASNEVEDILGFIYTNNIPLDKCTIAVTETNSYSQLFYDYSLQHGFKLTLGCGVPILNSNPARLLKAYTHWQTDGYHGVTALKDIVFGEAFNRKALAVLLGDEDMSRKDMGNILEAAGLLRISSDKDSNKAAIAGYEKTQPKKEMLSAVKVLAAELEKPVSEFIKDYSDVRDGHPGRIDRSAINVVTVALDSYFSHAAGGSIEEITREILNKSVCSENSREGALYVTSLSGAMASMRENLFIAGLSADSFPGSPRENYLLLDCDYELFAKEPDIPTSSECIRKKISTYHELRNLAAKLGVKVRLSYSDYDLAELKDKNLSSVVTEPVTRKTGFFAYDTDSAVSIGRAYNDGKDIIFHEPVKEEITSSCSLDYEYSPSAIDVFFNCPRAFMLSRVLGIEEPEEDKPFEVINAAEMGTLVHSMMEYKAEHRDDQISKEDFCKEGKNRFEVFLLAKRPILDDAAKSDEQTFMKILMNAYEQDPDNEVISAEDKKHVVHETGVKLKGIPDRVEKLSDGTNIIADFKTGSKLKHVKDDIDTCLQVIIYAYMMEKSGTPISACEYRYLRNPKIITCRYDDEMKGRLSDKLNIFKNALEKGEFPCSEDEESCRYCSFSAFCGKGEEA